MRQRCVLQPGDGVRRGAGLRFDFRWVRWHGELRHLRSGAGVRRERSRRESLRVRSELCGGGVRRTRWMRRHLQDRRVPGNVRPLLEWNVLRNSHRLLWWRVHLHVERQRELRSVRQHLPERFDVSGGGVQLSDDGGKRRRSLLPAGVDVHHGPRVAAVDVFQGAVDGGDAR